MAKKTYRTRKAGTHVVKAAESRSVGVASKKDGRAAVPNKSDLKIAKAVLNRWHKNAPSTP